MTSNNETVPAKISVQEILQTLLDSMTSAGNSAALPANIRELKQQTFSAQRRQPEVTLTSDSRFVPLWLAVATRRQRHIACFAVVSKT